ncbi:MAG TPA: DNRLRE domain-containing protein [Pseudobacteroides sp.]|uniref:DNRLRE domain-containing protein n=1 Tax=Pseudobacteroides sp. TaxID=1968840 RepID=UPI002F930F94
MTFTAAVYPYPVHYKNGNKYEDIDNSLISEKDVSGNQYLSNKANDFKIKIAKSSNSNKLVNIKKDKYELAWGVENIQKAIAQVEYDKTDSDILSENDKKMVLPNLSYTVCFENVFDNTDLKYQIESSSVKENIILKDKSEGQLEFRFDLDVKNLKATLLQDNTIEFYDEKDSSIKIFSIAAPFMYDKNGEESKNISVLLDETKKGYTLTIKPDIDWLNSSERAYPVTIDPDVTTQLSTAYIDDSYVSEASPSTNYSNSNLYVENSASGTRKYSYLKFVLPSLSSADIVTNATLSLKNISTTGGQIDLLKVTSAWTETGLAWSNRPTDDYITTDYKYVQSATSNQWDITKLVNGWYSGDIENNGVVLKYAKDGTKSDASSFYPSEDLSMINKPYITLNYINHAGLEGYWTYHSNDVGRAGTAYLNDANGNLVIVHDDLSLNGNRMPLSIKHIYNSAYKNTNNGFGYGWNLNLKQTLVGSNIGGIQYYIYTDEDGTKHYFSDYGSGFVDESGLNLSLTINANGTKRIKDKVDNYLDFDSGGKLTKITDSNGNSIIIEYSGPNITYVTDAADRKAKLNYDVNGNLSSIEYPIGTVKESFDYVSNELKTITYQDSKQSNYTYKTEIAGNDHRIETITDHTGYKYTYSYYFTTDKVGIIKESNSSTNGQEVGISYTAGQTSFKPAYPHPNKQSSIYQFNSYGNTVSTINNLMDATYYQYEDPTDLVKRNKVKVQSKLQVPVMNKVSDSGSFGTTDDTYWGVYNENNATGITSSGSSVESIYFGAGAFKVTKTSAGTGRFGLKQNYNPSNWAYATSLKRGKRYTLSGFIKSDGVSKQSSTGGACISVQYTDNSNNLVTLDSQYINGTNDWQRVDKVFDTPIQTGSSDSITVYVIMSILNETGTAYFDNLQIEDGAALNSYNCIENPDMTYTDTVNNVPWYMERINCETRDGVDNYTTGSNYPQKLDNKCFKIYGATNIAKALRSKINTGANGKSGDVFSVGCWAKGTSAPGTKMDWPISTTDRAFGLEVKFMNGTEVVNSDYFPCNPYTSDWQYVCGRVQAFGDYTSIVMTACYYNNLNIVYFDGFQLYKEEFGYSYTYDNKGNVSTVTGLNQDKTSNTYNATNDLTNSLSPMGNETRTDYNNHNPSNSSSTENMTSETLYDNYFNVRRTITGDGTNVIKTLSEYDTTNNYLKTQVDPLGRYTNYNYDTVNGKLDSISQLESVTGAVYSTTSYGYDTLNRITSVTKAVNDNGTMRNVVNEYSTKDANLNETDNLTKITHNGFNYNFNYDLLRNLTTVSVGAQPLITNSYDPNTSRLNSSTYGNGDVVGFDYDEYDRVIAKKYNGDARYKYSYDGNGKLSYYENRTDLAANSPSRKDFRYQYDVSGRQTKVIEYAGSNTNTTSYEYDIENRLGRTEEVVNNSSYHTGYIYDKSGTEKQTYFNTYSKNDGTVEYFPLNNNLNGALGTKPTSQNASFANDEYSIPMLAAFQGTTNLLGADTSFENGLQGWNIGAGAARTVYDGVDGSKCLEMYNQTQSTAPVQASVNKSYTSSSALATTNNYVVSIQLKTFKTVGHNAWIKVIGLNQSGVETTTIVNAPLNINYDGQWMRISTDSFQAPSGTYGLKVLVGCDVSGKQLVRVDNVQLEQKSFPTTYTSYTSPGTKVTYKIPTLSKTSGTFSAWFNLLSNTSPAVGEKWYVLTNEVKSGSTVTANLSVYINNNKHLIVEAKDTGGTTRTFDPGITIDSSNIRSPLPPAFQWYFMALTWQIQGTTLTGSLNIRSKFGTPTYNLPISIPNIANFDGATTAIGSDTSGNNQLNGLIGSVAYSKNMLSTTDINNMYNAGRTASINKVYDELGRPKETTIFTGTAGTSNDNYYRTTYNSYQNNMNEANTNGTTTLLTGMTYGITNGGMPKSIAYTYDIKGNIKSIIADKTITYKYNELNELIREDNPYLGTNGLTIVYDYDLGGNIKTKKEYGLLSPSVEPSGTPLATRTYTYDSVWKDKMIGYDGKTFDYDSIGNLRHIYQGANTLYTYDWEEGRNLKAITGSGLSTAYKYNDNGIRTEKTVGSTTTVYHLDGDRVTYEDNGTDKIYYRYDASGMLVSMNLNGAEYFYVRNGQGDIIALVDKSAIENPYRYRGYRYDTETGLYYLQSRYYNPEWGRFINADSFMGNKGEILSHNLFAYCLNNPVNYLDPDGEFAFVLAPLAIIAIKAAAATVLTAGAIILTYEAWEKAKDIIAKHKKGSINQKFPKEYYDKTIGEIEKDAKAGNKNAKAAKKLLNDKDFDKGSNSNRSKKGK